MLLIYLSAYALKTKYTKTYPYFAGTGNVLDRYFYIHPQVRTLRWKNSPSKRAISEWRVVIAEMKNPPMKMEEKG